MSETYRRRILYFAGTWNVVGGVGALADPSGHFAQMYNSSLALDDPLQAFFFRAVWINVAAWGIGYVLAGRNPAARLPILAAGGVGKVAYFSACLSLFMSGAGKSLLLAAGAIDVLFAAFFVYVLWSHVTESPAAR